MLSVEDALQIILDQTPILPGVEVSLWEAAGRTLAQSVVADEDIPPFDRSTMDGYALVAADTSGGEVELEVTEELFAGQTPSKTIRPGTAAKIMTGAPIPPGADCVVMVEHTETIGPHRIRVRQQALPRQNISRRGQFIRKGETLLQPGHVIRPVDLGVLAFVGVTRPVVFRPPACAILSTGDELVDPSERPGPGQIRNSNAYCLYAQLASAGAGVQPLGIGRDEPGSLATLVRSGLQADVFISTGGASVGEKDLVGEILRQEGVKIFFSQVAVKPGKPTLFGRKGNVLTYALPGNPLSAMVTCELFVLPALRKMSGQSLPEARQEKVRRGEGEVKPLNRRQFVPARLRSEGGEWVADLLPNSGSGDLISVIRADGFAIFPENSQIAEKGEFIDFLPLDTASLLTKSSVSI